MKNLKKPSPAALSLEKAFMAPGLSLRRQKIILQEFP
jgi:hypothetical protein